MSEIKNEIKQNVDGSFTITDSHSTADIVRWLLTQDSKETILYLLDETLAKPEQEPVAVVAEVHISRYTIEWTNGLLPEGTKLYTTPPQHKWVGLTDDDDLDWEEGGNLKDLVKAIEAKLKEKTV